MGIFSQKSSAITPDLPFVFVNKSRKLQTVLEVYGKRPTFSRSQNKGLSMRVASFTIPVLLSASILAGCGSQAAQDTQGLVATLPDSVTQTTDSDQPDDSTTPTSTKPTKPTHSKADDQPKTLAIAAIDPIAAN